MFSALKFSLSNPNCNTYTYSSSINSPSCRFFYHLRLPLRRRPLFTVLSHYESSTPPPPESEPPISSEYITSLGSSPFSHSTLHFSHWNLSQRHILMLNVIACAVAISATWLFFSAIPTLLAFKKAAESLEKLMDATREELPDTMAAIRLSGMEISDLTTELSDLGQEITQGVRSSTRAVRVAEERLRCLTNMAPPASLQRVASPKTQSGGPVAAKTARGIREGIVKGRTILQLFFTLTQFSRMALNYFAKRAKR